VREEDVSKLKAKVDSICREQRDKGFERPKIDGILHQIELSLKHKTSTFGLSLLHRLKPKWFTGVDPFDSLAWNDTLNAFHAKMAEGGYLEGLMDKYLLNNNTLTFTMAPSSSFGKEIAQEEEQRLAAKIKQATEMAGGETEAREAFEKQEQVLLKAQAKTTTEDLSCLPTVHVADIPRTKKPVVLRDDKIGDVSVQWREAPTNGLTYFRAIQTLQDFPDELRELMPLFSDAIMRLGTKDMTMEQLEDMIKLRTGGISVGYHFSPSPSDFKQAEEGIAFTGMALDRNIPAMFDLLRKLLVDTNFDSPEAAQRIRQLLQASADGMVNDIASSGHQFAKGYAESGLTRGAWLQQQVGGLSQVKLITALANRPESDQLADVIEKLKRIQQIALAGTGMRTALTCGVESVQSNTTALTNFLTARASRDPEAFSPGSAKLPTDRKAFFPLPYQVYYGGLALPTASYTSPDGAPLQILAQLLTHKHLHHEIREKGGAYGGGAYARAIDGLFGFYSYRDPNPQNTMAIMRNAGTFARDREWTDRDLEEAKISLFKGVDAPLSVNQEGLGKFLYGITENMKQKKREQLLDVTREQVRGVAQRYLVEGVEKERERVCFLGEEQGWVDGSWTVHAMDSAKE
jgi:Zn-dependent M16 (insulinase) family peptidase